MKITKNQHLSILLYCVLILSLVSMNFCSTMATLASFKSSSLKAKKHKQSPTLYENWASFFHYIETSNQVPHSFFTNKDFEPLKKNSEIPTKTSFYVQVTPNKVNFLTKKNISTIYDTLNIDFVKPIPENSQFNGGVKDLGKFNEGYCFQVLTIKPNTKFTMTEEEAAPKTGQNENWLICLKEEKDKNEMMNMILGLKLKKQRDLGIVLNLENKGNSKENGVDNKEIDPEINPSDLGPNDGYWIVLQDWSSCTLKCGGGKQVKQLQCIPPKAGGKPCQGAAIRERPCNTQPCPEPKQLADVVGKEPNPFKADAANAPVVKMMAISHRPQRYDKCHIKDTDASYINEKGMRIPIRLVMNNKVISAFQDENLSSALVTFLLEDTSFLLLKDNRACFRLENLNGHADFCSLVESCTSCTTSGAVDTFHTNFVNEWNRDFNQFKTQCFQKRDVKTYELNEDQEFLKKQNELKNEFIQNKIRQIKQETNKSEEYQLIKKKQETQAMTMSALLKEKKLEELLLKEEAEREEEELKEIQVQLEKEKKKKDCMQRAIKEKTEAGAVVLSTTEAEKEIKKMKEKVQAEIKIKRDEIQQKIKQMRMRNERKKKNLYHQIQVLRTETAEDIQRVSKKGSMEVCQDIMKSTGQEQAEKMNHYYAAHLINYDPSLTSTPLEFCNSCCESEFGELYIAEREKCYETACSLAEEKNLK